MRKGIYALVILAILAYGYIDDRRVSGPGSPEPRGAATAVQQAYDNQQSDVQVQGAGIVSRVLPDDLEGSRHQRFILDTGQGHSLLIAHNIDLAPRVEGIRKGDRVEFHGEYEWNPKGGVVHWTHHDPVGRHTGGWLKHSGQTYQ